jgi:hypothetical protein
MRLCVYAFMRICVNAFACSRICAFTLLQAGQVVLFAYLFQLFEKLGHTLADDFGIAAHGHKVCIAVPSRHEMDMKMAWQARSGASAEVHPDIKAVRSYRQRQGFLAFTDQLYQFQQLFIACRFEVGNVTGRRYQQMAVVVGEAIEYYDASVRTPEHKIFIIVSGPFMCLAYKAIAAFVKVLDIIDTPRRP